MGRKVHQFAMGSLDLDSFKTDATAVVPVPDKARLYQTKHAATGVASVDVKQG